MKLILSLFQKEYFYVLIQSKHLSFRGHLLDPVAIQKTQEEGFLREFIFTGCNYKTKKGVGGTNHLFFSNKGRVFQSNLIEKKSSARHILLPLYLSISCLKGKILKLPAALMLM